MTGVASRQNQRRQWSLGFWSGCGLSPTSITDGFRTRISPVNCFARLRVKIFKFQLATAPVSSEKLEEAVTVTFEAQFLAARDENRLGHSRLVFDVETVVPCVEHVAVFVQAKGPEVFKLLIGLRTAFGSISFKEMKPVFSVSSSPQSFRRFPVKPICRHR